MSPPCEGLPRTTIVPFARDLKEPAFTAREALAGEDARTLARELLSMTQEEFGTAFTGSPMKRAKLRGLKRTSAVVLGNIGSSEDADVLTRVLEEESDELIREHAVWAMQRIARGSPDVTPLIEAPLHAPADELS